MASGEVGVPIHEASEAGGELDNCTRGEAGVLFFRKARSSGSEYPTDSFLFDLPVEVPGLVYKTGTCSPSLIQRLRYR